METFLSELFSAAKTAGPFSTLLMIGLWWLERGERIENQKLNRDLVPEMLKAINATKTAVRNLTAIVTGRNGVADDD